MVAPIETLRAIHLKDGWYICDDDGPLDGPYRSERDCLAVIQEWAEDERPE